MEAIAPSLALAAYAEPLLEGRRVAVVGNALSGLAESLLERGARVVHVYDPEVTRAAEAAARNSSRNMTYAPLSEDDVAVRDGVFDLVLVEDLSALDEPAAVLKQVRRSVSSRGTALITSPNPDAPPRLLHRSGTSRTALSYYDLYDLVAVEFREIRMLGQTPFVGYAVIDFAPEGDPDVALDTGFLPRGAEEPEWFIALASQRVQHLDPFSIVQLPAADVLRHAGPGRPDPAPRKKELARQEASLAKLEARVAAAEARADEAKEELERERDRAEAAIRAQRALEVEARKLRERLASLEEPGRTSLKEQEARIHRLEATVRQRDDRIAELERRLEADLRQRDDRISELEQRLEETHRSQKAGSEDDYALLEGALKERGDEIRRLQGELREAERIGRELLAELEEARANGQLAGSDEERAGLEARLQELVALNARHEADLVAARWTIEELEGRLLEAGAHAETDGEQLRRELEEVRAQLQRQATALAQARQPKPDGGPR